MFNAWVCAAVHTWMTSVSVPVESLHRVVRGIRAADTPNSPERQVSGGARGSGAGPASGAVLAISCIDGGRRAALVLCVSEWRCCCLIFGLLRPFWPSFS